MSKNGDDIVKKSGFLDDVPEVDSGFEDDWGDDDIEDFVEDDAIKPVDSQAEKEPEPTWHEHILELTKTSGLGLESKGLCYGIALTGTFAFLRGSSATRAFMESFIASNSMSTEELKRIHDDLPELLKTRVQEPLQKYRDSLLEKAKLLNPTLDEKETLKKIDASLIMKDHRRVLLDQVQSEPEIKKYFDTMALLHEFKINYDLKKYPQLAPEATKFHGLTQAVKESAAISKSQGQEEIGEHKRFITSSTKSELLNTVNKYIEACHGIDEPLGFLFSTRSHTISCSYDPVQMTWLLLDANQGPEYHAVTPNEVRDYIWDGLYEEARNTNGVLVMMTQVITTQTADQKLSANVKIDNQFTSDLTSDKFNQLTEEGKKERLVLACLEGHHTEVEWLLKNGMSPNVTLASGISPLLVAAQNGHVKIVEALLEKIKDKKDVDVVMPESGATPLIAAARNGHAKVVELLLSAGANVLHENSVGDTAIMAAESKGHTEVVQILGGAEERRLFDDIVDDVEILDFNSSSKKNKL